MPTQAIAGYNGAVRISVDGGINYNAYGELQDGSFKVDAKDLDATSHSSGGWEESIKGNKAWTATLKGLYVASDTVQAALVTAIIAGTKLKVQIDPYGTASGKPRFSGDAFLNSAEVAMPNADIETANFSLKGTGALTASTQ